ncbi:hypothetical protein K439DRAFT_1640915 [Ramaria rubella]|nr:hypothetical protein K439DRAFT_1640915 [Ramaria rubella]
MLPNPSQRTRRSLSDIPGMDQPQLQLEDPPPHPRMMRTNSMPLSHPQADPLQPLQSYSSQRRGSPGPMSTSQPQHVPPPNSHNFSTVHSQFHSHTDQPSDHSQVHAPPQHTPPPPLTFPRPVQRVPPPPLIPPDSRYNSLHAEWTMTDQLLAEIDRAAQDQEASNNIAAIGAGSGQVQHSSVTIPKGPIIERERDRAREKRDSPREGDVGGSGGSAGSGPGRSGSLRQSSIAQPQQPQTKNETPPRTPPYAQMAQGQSQRPLPSVPAGSQSGTSRSDGRERGSPTYYPSPQGDTPHYAQPQAQSHSRDNSPPFRYEERAPSKAKTPDRSLPVQEENEGEEDATITPSTERERARERERQHELDMDTLKERPRQMNHRLPTPQFSSSPMLPPDRMQVTSTSSDVELSSTVQGDDYDDHGPYDNDHDGRSSRAAIRFDDDEALHQDKDDTRRHTEGEDPDETESYTPRSHHANLPQTTNGGPSTNTERVLYTATQQQSHFPHFRPRTASSDAGGMVNLDTAMLHDAIERLQPYAPEYIHNQNHSSLDHLASLRREFNGHNSPYSASHPHGQHTALPQRLPTADELRALMYDSRHDAWQRQASAIAANHVRPGAPVPPTPPNAATLSTLSYAPPSLPSHSPPPPRSTPYPFGYAYPHIMRQSQDSQHSQLQQLQQLQYLAATGMQTDSTFSPSSTPYPSYDYSPFLPEHFRRAAMDDPSMSLRSSPSHMPVNLPVFTPGRRVPSKRKSVRRMRGSRELAAKLPPRGESTEPRETSPESSDGEEGEVDREEVEEFNELATRLETEASEGNASTERGHGRAGSQHEEGSHRGGGEEEDQWIDEDEDEEDDLLHLEYHPNFVVNPDKRRKRWELKWDALVKAFQALDRQTDSTLLLLAAPTHSKTLHAVRSRSLRRIPSLATAPALHEVKSSFRALATQRQAARAHTRHMSLAERFEQYTATSSTSDGSEREEELKGALGAALSSLSALSSIYEGREQRWRTEMGRMGDERERVEVLLRQALGMGFGPGVL